MIAGDDVTKRGSKSYIDCAPDPWLPTEDKNDNYQRIAIPSMTQPFYNQVFDVHATVSAADTLLKLSVNGNWQFALRLLLERKYFKENESVKNSYIYTTSPPMAIPQMKSGIVKVGNVMYTDAEPHLVVAPGKGITKFENNGFSEGSRIPIIRTYGSVILKRKGDDRFNSFWDLANIEPGRFASSHPSEGGSYDNYRNTVFNIAKENPRSPDLSEEEVLLEAEELQTRLFGDDGVTAGIGFPMHRSVPHSIATGLADAGLFFLHLAVMVMGQNPNVFEAVYLSSDKNPRSTDDPSVLARGQNMLPGDQASVFFAIRSNISTNDAQEAARERLIEDLQSEEFTSILSEVGLRRPE